MFTGTLLRIEVLSLELRTKTQELSKAVTRCLGGSKNGNGLSQLDQQEREVIDCGTRLVQSIEDKEVILEELKRGGKTDQADQLSNTTPTRTTDGQRPSRGTETTPVETTPCGNSLCDSGIDVTEEEREEIVSRVPGVMNGASVPLASSEPLEALRATLRSLKRATDKAVFEFLMRSRHVLHDELKNKSDVTRDQKLLALISDILTHKQHADKQLTEMELDREDRNPLSVLEKSLCYVLVDKALLNCLLILDKAFMEGKLSDYELALQQNAASSGQKVISEFSQVIGEKKQFVEMTEELRKKEEVIEAMRGQIRELSSEKCRLESETKSLEETSHSLSLKIKEIEMQNSVIDDERQLLKEKVYFLDESMAELQSGTRHLRRQIQDLERQEEEARKENVLLKEQLKNQNQNEEQKLAEDLATDVNHASDSCTELFITKAYEDDQVNCVAGFSSSQIDDDVRTNRKAIVEPFSFKEAVKLQSSGVHKDALGSSSEVDVVERVKSLTSENKELRDKLGCLEDSEVELRKTVERLTHVHSKAIYEKNEELRVAKERSEACEEQLEERLTEVVLLKAQVLELEKTRNLIVKEKQNTENAMMSMKGERNSSKGDMISRQNDDVRKVCNLMRDFESYGGNDAAVDSMSTGVNDLVYEASGPNGISSNVSSYPEQFLSTDGALQEREQTIQSLKERSTVSEHRVQEMTELLENLAHRKEILVNKLEMIGAVTVIRNDFDIPDGYQEAVDARLRSQSSMIEKGVLAMAREAEEKDNERKQLEEECRKLKYNSEALETENLLLRLQVSDLSHSVEELEDDVISMKCGRKGGSKQGKRPSTPKSGGNGGHRVTFGGDVGLEKKEGEKLGSLIETAKERCISLERQIRSNTSLMKATQHKNEILVRDQEELKRRNGHLRHHLSDFQQTNKILEIKVAELENRLKDVGEGKSLDDMERQSLEDRLRIVEGQAKYLKHRVETLQSESNSSDETGRQCQGLHTKLIAAEKDFDDVFDRKSKLGNEIERLKNKVKRQSSQSRTLKCELFEFLDDVRCLESDLNCIVDSVETADQKVISLDAVATADTDIVSTWRDEASVCQREGMTPIMVEILELLRSAVKRLKRISSGRETPLSILNDGSANAGGDRKVLLSQQFREETEKLKAEKLQVQREVLVMKAILEHLLELGDSPEASHKAREAERSGRLTRQILFYVERNSKMEGEVLELLKQQSVLQQELDILKEGILNLKGEKDALFSLSGAEECPGELHSCSKSCDRVMRTFCFVKRDGQGFEPQGVLQIDAGNDSEDVFSCPSDESVCHSPDREAGSCDSGYHDEGHSVFLSDKGDTGPYSRYVSTSTEHTSRSFQGSYYENVGRDQRRKEIGSSSTADKKPKGILKKRTKTEEKRNGRSEMNVAGESYGGIDGLGCRVCNFSDLFTPFKRANQETENSNEYSQ